MQKALTNIKVEKYISDITGYKYKYMLAPYLLLLRSPVFDYRMFTQISHS